MSSSCTLTPVSLVDGKDGKRQATNAEVCVHELDHREKHQEGKRDELKKADDKTYGNKSEKSAVEAENRFNAQDKSGAPRSDRINHK